MSVTTSDSSTSSTIDEQLRQHIAEELAGQYAEILVRWSESYRRRGAATFRYIPADTARGTFPAHSVIKHHGAVKVTWS